MLLTLLLACLLERSVYRLWCHVLNEFNSNYLGLIAVAWAMEICSVESAMMPV